MEMKKGMNQLSGDRVIPDKMTERVMPNKVDERLDIKRLDMT